MFLGVRWFQWFGILLFLVCGIGGAIYGVTLPGDTVDADGTGVTLFGRIGTIVVSLVMGVGPAIWIFLGARKQNK